MAQEVIRDLGDGLIIRKATIEDVDNLTKFNSIVHSEKGEEEPLEFLAAWTRDLMTKPHPTFNVSDFLIVLDTTTDQIVSSSNLISQTWSYDGVEFGVGRPELVGTHPEYRRRGLVRAQFEIMHSWSEARGHRMQTITGIPWFYRQFDYEMAIELDGGRNSYKVHVPELKEDEKEVYLIRDAEESDLPFIAELYNIGSKRSLISCSRDEALWKYELCGRDPKNVCHMKLRMITTLDGSPVGFFVHNSTMWNGLITARALEIKPGISWLAVAPSIMRDLANSAAELAKKDEKGKFDAIAWRLGSQHPLYEVIPQRIPRLIPPYAWYVRVPEIASFLELIRPVLEKRIADSLLTGHSGELKLNFFRDGLKLVFENGKMVGIEPWHAERFEEGDIVFPELTFLQVLFGFKSTTELTQLLPDCYARNETGEVLGEILFPRKPSAIWPVA